MSVISRILVSIAFIAFSYNTGLGQSVAYKKFFYEGLRARAVSNTDIAIAALESARLSYSEDIGASALLGILYSEIGDLKSSNDLFLSCLKKEKSNTLLVYLLALNYLKETDSSKFLELINSRVMQLSLQLSLFEMLINTKNQSQISYVMDKFINSEPDRVHYLNYIMPILQRNQFETIVEDLSSKYNYRFIHKDNKLTENKNSFLDYEHLEGTDSVQLSLIINNSLRNEEQESKLRSSIRNISNIDNKRIALNLMYHSTGNYQDLSDMLLFEFEHNILNARKLEECVLKFPYLPDIYVYKALVSDNREEFTKHLYEAVLYAEPNSIWGNTIDILLYLSGITSSCSKCDSFNKPLIKFALQNEKLINSVFNSNLEQFDKILKEAKRND